MHQQKSRVVRALAGGMLIACVPHAVAADYPSRPMRMIVPFAPGGPTDIVARLVAQKLSEGMGQQVVVDNRPGAGGNIGMGLGAKANPDGYTITTVSSSFVVNPSLYKNTPYAALENFAPVTCAASTPNLLMVHASFPATSVKALIQQLRAQPGKHGFASPGTGTTPHLSGELFRLAFKLDLAHIPYNGAGPAVGAVVAGQVPIGFAALPTATPFVQSGKLRGLALTAAKRSAAIPDVPTMKESGIDGMEAETMAGVLVPAGTPRAIVERLNAEVVRAVRSPHVQKRLLGLGFDPIGNSQDEFAAYIRSELDRWAKVIREAGIKVN